MSRPIASRLMVKEEFLLVVEDLKGGREGWLDRVNQLTEIDKPTLKKYATGERPISNAHALFIRQMYLLDKAFPDLSSDINVLMRQIINEKKSLSVYDDMKTKAKLMTEIKKLKAALAKIENMAKSI